MTSVYSPTVNESIDESHQINGRQNTWELTTRVFVYVRWHCVCVRESDADIIEWSSILDYTGT